MGRVAFDKLLGSTIVKMSSDSKFLKTEDIYI